MKEEEIEDLGKIIEEEKLPKEKKKKTLKMAFENFLNANSIMLLLIVLMAIPNFEKKEFIILIYKIISGFLLLFSIFLFERAYKKKDGITATYGIEMLVLATIILYAPYGFIKFDNIYLKLSGVYFAVYYIIKTIIMYARTRKEHKDSVSDISEIVKKESKDNIRKKKQKEEEEKQEEFKNEINYLEKPEIIKKEDKKKETNQKDIVKETKKADSKKTESKKKVSTKKEIKTEIEEKPKATRGRPPKNKQEVNPEKEVKKTLAKTKTSTKTSANKQAPKTTKKKTTVKKKEVEVKEEAPKKRGRPRKEPIAK